MTGRTKRINERAAGVVTRVPFRLERCVCCRIPVLWCESAVGLCMCRDCLEQSRERIEIDFDYEELGWG
jgi:hypothetical protein